jgi:hypothetical protein
MNKLLKLKSWLTVPDAARHLSILSGQEITEADVLRLAMDRHLTLSMYIVSPQVALIGKIIPHSDAEFEEEPLEMNPIVYSRMALSWTQIKC